MNIWKNMKTKTKKRIFWAMLPIWLPCCVVLLPVIVACIGVRIVCERLVDVLTKGGD